MGTLSPPVWEFHYVTGGGALLSLTDHLLYCMEYLPNAMRYKDKFLSSFLLSPES